MNGQQKCMKSTNFLPKFKEWQVLGQIDSFRPTLDISTMELWNGNLDSSTPLQVQAIHNGMVNTRRSGLVRWANGVAT